LLVQTHTEVLAVVVLAVQGLYQQTLVLLVGKVVLV
jgi:hypothetical protein